MRHLSILFINILIISSCNKVHNDVTWVSTTPENNWKIQQINSSDSDAENPVLIYLDEH